MILSLLSLLTLLIAQSGAWTPTVHTGLDVLATSNFTQLSGRKVIVLSNPTGVTASLDLGVDVMFRAKVDLAGVMGPEHGFRGTQQAGSGAGGTFIDPETGLTVYDAYNANTTTLVKFITESGADTVVFDIQDVGARFYTYTWAMYDTLVASTLCNTTFVVLDRPNPITGLSAFGPILNESYASYVGRRPIAQAHGMTAGELATMFVGEGWIQQAVEAFAASSSSNSSSTGFGPVSDVKLEVIKMTGWERWMSWADTGLTWVMPSPNMASPITATLYPGTCMFEGTNLSEGRGTVRPFELLSSPFTNSTWSDAMRNLPNPIPNTSFRPACFAPTESKWLGNTSCGIEVYVDFCSDGRCSDAADTRVGGTYPYETFDPVYLGVSLLSTARRLFSSQSGNATSAFQWLYNGSNSSVYDVDVLSGGTLIREGIEAGMSPDEIKAAWTPALEAWKSNVRAKYLMY